MRADQPPAAAALWREPPAKPVTSAQEVHVWRTFLDRSPDEVELLGSLLSHDEHHRAERLIFPEDRQRFIVARGSLRTILSRYLSIAAVDIHFEYGLHGKPQLSPELAQPLYFNLSHSANLALVSVTGLGATGIDIEQLSPDFPCIQIARGFFSPTEIEELGRLPTAEHCSAFFRCWTRKEAFIKATGKGLSLPLDQFDVTLAETATLLSTAWDRDEAAQWSLHTLDAACGFAASLAVRGHGYSLHCWTFDQPFLPSTVPGQLLPVQIHRTVLEVAGDKYTGLCRVARRLPDTGIGSDTGCCCNALHHLKSDA